MTDGGSSVPAVQRLLAALVASKPEGRFAETGTAFGAGARAIVEAMGSGATFVTVEIDRERHEQARAQRFQKPAWKWFTAAGKSLFRRRPHST